MLSPNVLKGDWGGGGKGKQSLLVKHEDKDVLPPTSTAQHPATNTKDPQTVTCKLSILSAGSITDSEIIMEQPQKGFLNIVLLHQLTRF